MIFFIFPARMNPESETRSELCLSPDLYEMIEKLVDKEEYQTLRVMFSTIESQPAQWEFLELVFSKLAGGDAFHKRHINNTDMLTWCYNQKYEPEIELVRMWMDQYDRSPVKRKNSKVRAWLLEHVDFGDP